jgi:hypothetical protein
VDNAEDAKKLCTQLVALVKHGRTFAHKTRPLQWSEVRHLRRHGCRCLLEVYGGGSPEYEAFMRLTEQAFSFLPARSDHIHKVEVLSGDGVMLVSGGEDRVYHLNRLDWNSGLQILIEAGRRLRAETRKTPGLPMLDVPKPQSTNSSEPSHSAGAGTDSTSWPRKRLPSTISSPIAAARMSDHLAKNQIGQTEFANRVGTTDRTLRNFRQKGKIRRDIFDKIATEMCLTREQLLEPEE